MNPKQKYTSSILGSMGNAQNNFNTASPAMKSYGATKTVANPTGTLQNKPTTPVTPSNTSATGTTGTKITSPAGQSYVNTLVNQPSQPSVPTAPTTPTTPSTPSYQNTPEYKEYLKYTRNKENPSEADMARKAYESNMKRLADAQNAREKAELDARKGVEKTLDTPGGLKSGTVAGAGVYARRSNDDIADLALAESAAARSAGVALDVYEPFKTQAETENKPLSIEEATSLGVPFGTTYGEAKSMGKIPFSGASEGFTLGKDQTRYEYNPTTGTYEVIGGGGGSTQPGSSTYVRGADPAVDAYIQGIRNQTYKPSDVPDEYRSAVAQGLAQVDRTMASEGARETLTIVDELLANPALAGVTGPAQQFRPDLLTGSQGILAKNKIDQLIANLKLDARQKLKGSGAISDFEFRVLGQAATSIHKNLPFDVLTTELQALKDKLSGNSPIPTTPVNGDLWKAPDGAEYEFMNGQWEQMNEGFSQVGNTSVSIPQSSRLAYVNNNPGNLRFAGQEGATQGEGGFARFSSPQAGAQALQRQIELDASRGLTLAQFINKYAPPTENDTQKYINDMIAMTGATPLTPLSSIDIGALTRAIAKKESSTNIA